MKFLIISPRPVAGGAIVLHVLCRELGILGHEAKILYCPNEGRISLETNRTFWRQLINYNIKDLAGRAIYLASKMLTRGKFAVFEKHFYNPVGFCKRCFIPKIDQDTVVIYPDIIWGNPLKASKVVRWLLYFNRFPGDKYAYGDKDLFFCYREIFNDYDLNPSGRSLFLQNFDFNLYKQTNFEERSGCCYIIRKGKNRSDLPKQFAGPVIDSWSERKKVQAFNKYKYCYCYDTQTFYTVVAAVCGCIPIVILEPGKSKVDYLGEGEIALGVAYGNTQQEIAFAVETKDACIQQLQNFEQRNKKAVCAFFYTCQEYFQINSK